MILKESSASKRYKPIFDEDGRVCRDCDAWKPWDDFHQHPEGINGKNSTCKPCALARMKVRRATPEGKKKSAEAHLRRRSKPDYVDVTRAKEQKKQSDPIARARKNEQRLAPHRREKRNATRRARLKADKNYALAERARGMVHRCLRAAGLAKHLPTFDMLGYGPEKLMARIECQFKPGMSWDNHSEWHIDHIKPITAFIAQGKTDTRLINSLCNLRPMWASENMSKNNKWPLADNDNVPERVAA